MPPLGRYFPRLLKSRKGRRVYCGPQTERTPDPAGCFPCKTPVFRGPPEGAMIAVVDPRQADAVMVGEGHAPVVAVLLAAAKKGRRVHGGPQMARTPRLCGFFPAKRLFSGDRRRGPSWTARQADAVMVSEGHAPVVAVLSRLLQERVLAGPADGGACPRPAVREPLAGVYRCIRTPRSD